MRIKEKVKIVQNGKVRITQLNNTNIKYEIKVEDPYDNSLWREVHHIMDGIKEVKK